MYFTNIYVSILNTFTNGVEATLDMPGLPVKPGLLGKGIAPVLSQKRVIGPDALGITPRSVMNSFTQIASCAASEAAIDRKSVV